MTEQDYKSSAEAAALAALQAVLTDPAASPAAKVRAAAAILHHTKPRPKPAGKATPPQRRTQAELEQALRLVRSKQYPAG